jgi:hypothetical protein
MRYPQLFPLALLALGPTGLLGAIHCLHNVILSGGEVKVYEKREAFERAQIVRLDARQIAMVRYHLGTGFEDVYIPVSSLHESQRMNQASLTVKFRPNRPKVKLTRIMVTHCKYCTRASVCK